MDTDKGREEKQTCMKTHGVGSDLARGFFRPVRANRSPFPTLLVLFLLGRSAGETRKVLEEGFRRQVLGFSTHFILERMSRKSEYKTWADRGVVKSTFEIFFEEVHGSLAEERQSRSSMPSMKESRGTKAFDAVEIVATALDFPKDASTMFNLCKAKLSE